MDRSAGGGVFRRPCFWVLLGTSLSTTVALDTSTRQIHVPAGSERAAAQTAPADPAAAHPAGVVGELPDDPCPAARTLTSGVAEDVSDLLAMAQQLSEGGAADIAERLRATAARLEARFDRRRSAAAAAAAAQQDATGRGSRYFLSQSTMQPKNGSLTRDPAFVRGDGNTSGDDHWGVTDSEGGSDKTNSWDSEATEGLGSWIFASVFVGIIAIAPIVPHLRRGAEPPTKVHYCESLVLFLWLFSGLYLFHYQIEFQSPHFSKSRTLRLEESVYLISQIVTTVGYGDITPAKSMGQLFVAFFAFTAVMLISKILGDLVATFQDAMEDTLLEDVDEASAKTSEEKLWAAWVPVLQSGGVFLFFLMLGVGFFWLYPGEDKTLGQATYMSIVTLSTVGFGAFTPVTRGGMVFGAYWMLFGVGSLGALVSARVAFTAALISTEREKDKENNSPTKSAPLGSG